MRRRDDSTPWADGRFDGRAGPGLLLFGRMHEDAAIEAAAFRPGTRVFCIASAGCTAMDLCRRHEVVACDINPAQVAYAAGRFRGGPRREGLAERRMALGRAIAPAFGWRRSRLREFMDLDDPAAQIAYWRRHLATRRFRAAMDAALSRPVLSLTYAATFLRVLPPRFGAVMRGRMERGFARHPNRRNPHARALFLGEARERPPLPEAGRIRLVHADAADFLERQPPASFGGFTLSNILDGTGDAYRRRLLAAVGRAAAPGAVVVLRSFADLPDPSARNLAAEDRAMLWGTVAVGPAEAL